MVTSEPPDDFEDAPASMPQCGAPAPTPPGAVPASRLGRAWRAVRERNHTRQDLIYLAVVVVWVVLDQATKVALRESLERGEHWELASFYRFSHVVNDGAAFGLFQGSGVWLAILPVLAIVAIAAYYLFPPVDHWLTRLGLALILGGAIGNWLDRIYQGEVTDFIDFIHFPAFNVADIGINVGIAAIILYLVIVDARRAPRHR